jgi:hypothetical protein
LVGQAPGIFISYRRQDGSSYAGRLSDGLIARFGSDRVFMDIDGIAPGADFWGRIVEVIDGCAVVLVVIGDEWLSAATEAGRRLDDPDDFVRREIETALAQQAMTIPVLVGGTTMPSEHVLPKEIARLARLNAIELSDMRWRDDVNRLMSTISGVLDAPTGENTERTSSSFVEIAPDNWDRTGQSRWRWPWRRSEGN